MQINIKKGKNDLVSQDRLPESFRALSQIPLRLTRESPDGPLASETSTIRRAALASLRLSIIVIISDIARLTQHAVVQVELLRVSESHSLPRLRCTVFLPIRTFHRRIRLEGEWSRQTRRRSEMEGGEPSLNLGERERNDEVGQTEESQGRIGEIEQHPVVQVMDAETALCVRSGWAVGRVVWPWWGVREWMGRKGSVFRREEGEREVVSSRKDAAGDCMSADPILSAQESPRRYSHAVDIVDGSTVLELDLSACDLPDGREHANFFRVLWRIRSIPWDAEGGGRTSCLIDARQTFRRCRSRLSACMNRGSEFAGDVVAGSGIADDENRLCVKGDDRYSELGSLTHSRWSVPTLSLNCFASRYHLA